MQVIPVADYDSMLMTLNGAHSPWFTRNLVILKGSEEMEAIDFCKPMEREESEHGNVTVFLRFRIHT